MFLNTYLGDQTFVDQSNVPVLYRLSFARCYLFHEQLFSTESSSARRRSPVYTELFSHPVSREAHQHCLLRLVPFFFTCSSFKAQRRNFIFMFLTLVR